jgi:hypothetical protein
VSYSSAIIWCACETSCLAQHGAPSGFPSPSPTGIRGCASLLRVPIVFPGLTHPCSSVRSAHCTLWRGELDHCELGLLARRGAGCASGGCPFITHANTTQYIQISHQSIAIHPISTRHALRVGPVRSCSRYTARRKREQHGREVAWGSKRLETKTAGSMKKWQCQEGDAAEYAYCLVITCCCSRIMRSDVPPDVGLHSSFPHCRFCTADLANPTSAYGQA